MKGDHDFPNTEPLTTKSVPSLPLSSPGWNLVKTFKSFRLIEDEKGHAYVLPVIITDPAQDSMVPMGIYLGTSVLKQGSAPGNGPWVYAVPEFYNPATGTYEQQRTPTVWKSVLVTTAAATVVWDPAVGKKFRLMGGHIDVSGSCTLAAAADQLIRLYDDVNPVPVDFNVRIPNAVQATNNNFVFSLPGNGYLSAVVDNNLTVTMTGNLAAGNVLVNVWGTEE